MRVLRIVSLLLSLIFVISLCACTAKTNETLTSEEIADEASLTLLEGDDTPETWAFYWYLCGSDLESEHGLASIDIEEMMQVELPEQVSVVIETGGANEWKSDISAKHNSRYLYDGEDLSLLEEMPAANMGDAKTLENFLRYCNEFYPADNRAVIFWNHGGGSLSGVAFDEVFGFDSLTLPEMHEAFEKSDATSEQKYELIGFDTCLMATIDVVDTVNDFANFLVASEELEPGGGWDYEALFQSVSDNLNMTGAELGKEICDSYYAACEKDETEDTVTLSVIDLSQTEELLEAYNEIGAEALTSAGMDPSFLGEFGRAASRAENYGGNNKTDGYTNMVDLGDLVHKASDKLLPTTGDALLTALNNAVLYQVNGPLRSNASGLSCYYSFNGDYEEYSRFAGLNTSSAFQYYFDYMLSGEISDELVSYLATVSSSYSEEEIVPQSLAMPKADELEDFPVEITDDGIAILNLGAEIAEKLSGIYVNLAYIDEESGSALFLGSDNDLEADWENGVFQDNFRGVWGSLDGNLVYMELSDEADDYQVYAVPTLLNGEEHTMLVSYIFPTEEFRILGFRRGIDDNGMADGTIRPLIPGDIVEPLHYLIDLETDEVTQVAVDKVTVTSNTRFYEAEMGDGEFLFLFEMMDIQNTSYLSEAISITVKDGEIFLSH